MRLGLKSTNKLDLVIKGKSRTKSQTFINDAAKIWNEALCAIKDCISLLLAKIQIKIFIEMLPI